jgi:hypothetical protein
MHIVRRRFAGAAVALLGVLALLPATTAHAATPPGSVVEAEGHLVEFQRLGLSTDVDAQVAYLRQSDPGLADAWQGIVDDWSRWLYGYKIFGSDDPDVLPDDLPTLADDDGASLAFVLLGQKLNDDGSASQQLIDRLRVTKAALDRYPRSHVVVTGGHTANDNPDATEGEVMRDWLEAEGGDRCRPHPHGDGCGRHARQRDHGHAAAVRAQVRRRPELRRRG